MLTHEEKTIFSKVVPHLPHAPIIFDVGAYKGEYTDYVKSVLPDAECYLFEANSELVDGLLDRYCAFNVMLSDSIGYKQFYRCRNKADELSSMYLRQVFEQVEFVTDMLITSTVDRISAKLKLSNIHFLKIDVEGAELDVLKGAKRMLTEKRILFAQVEYGGTYPDAGITFKQVINYLDNLDYKVYELKGNELSLLTEENFIEDYRFSNFLISHVCI